jgi:hypothetical protein
MFMYVDAESIFPIEENIWQLLTVSLGKRSATRSRADVCGRMRDEGREHNDGRRVVKNSSGGPSTRLAWRIPGIV